MREKAERFSLLTPDANTPWWQGPLRFTVALVVGAVIAAMVGARATDAGQVLGYGETRILAVLVAILFDQTREEP